MRRRPIYVESPIRCEIDDLWAATQDPALHQRWDLRFGEITYLPRADGEPQRFTYATTVAPRAFTVVERACAPDEIPLDVKPLREESRE